MSRPAAFESLHWGIAILLSLLLHGLLVWQQDTRLYSHDGKEPRQTGITRLTFRTLPRPTPPAPVPESVPEVKPSVKPRPLTTQTEQPRALRKPDRPKRAIRPTPAPQIAAQPKHEAQAPQTPAAGEPHISQQARSNYLGSLVAHIETYKFYPRAARQRGIQGVIQVSFRLQANGGITDIQIEDGHMLLRNATEQALQRAQPLPKPPPGMELPLLVSYGMEYRLR